MLVLLCTISVLFCSYSPYIYGYVCIGCIEVKFLFSFFCWLRWNKTALINELNGQQRMKSLLNVAQQNATIAIFFHLLSMLLLGCRMAIFLSRTIKSTKWALMYYGSGCWLSKVQRSSTTVLWRSATFWQPTTPSTERRAYRFIGVWYIIYVMHYIPYSSN